MLTPFTSTFRTKPRGKIHKVLSALKREFVKLNQHILPNRDPPNWSHLGYAQRDNGKIDLLTYDSQIKRQARLDRMLRFSLYQRKFYKTTEMYAFFEMFNNGGNANNIMSKTTILNYHCMTLFRGVIKLLLLLLSI